MSLDTPSPTTLPDVLTIAELASLLRLRPKSVYDMLARDPRVIPGVRKVGGAWRAHRDTVLGWLAGRDDGPGRRGRGGRT